MHDCGHYCFGNQNDVRYKSHPPCLFPECVKKDPSKTHGEDKDSFCCICFTDELAEKPVIYLECGHIFHEGCLQTIINKRWGKNEDALNFRFIECPTCSGELKTGEKQFDSRIDPYRQLKKKTVEKAVKRAEFEGMDKEPRLQQKGSGYYQNLEKFAMDKLVYYRCNKC